eukprot:1080655-Prorocentrum_minimum.AAC.1
MRCKPGVHDVRATSSGATKQQWMLRATLWMLRAILWMLRAITWLLRARIRMLTAHAFPTASMCRKSRQITCRPFVDMCKRVAYNALPGTVRPYSVTHGSHSR